MTKILTSIESSLKIVRPLLNIRLFQANLAKFETELTSSFKITIF